MRAHDESRSPKQRSEGSGKAQEGKDLPPCWSRGQGRLFEEAFEKEEEVYRTREERVRRERGEGGQVDEVQSFERYREVGRSGM